MAASSQFAMFWICNLLNIILLIETCHSEYIVWSDDLDNVNDGDWTINGAINDSIHLSTNCPSSNDCWRIHSIINKEKINENNKNEFSSITTSISTDDYLNFTLKFGITIIDEVTFSLQQNKRTNFTKIYKSHDYCRINYRIKKYDLNGQLIITDWANLASYSYDDTNHFNNKLPLQMHQLPISKNNQYYKSIDIRFINTANDSETPFSCFIDRVSLTANYYNAPKGWLQIDTFCMMFDYIL